MPRAAKRTPEFTEVVEDADTFVRWVAHQIEHWQYTVYDLDVSSLSVLLRRPGLYRCPYVVVQFTPEDPTGRRIWEEFENLTLASEFIRSLAS